MESDHPKSLPGELGCHDPNNWLRMALESTDRVGTRLDETLGSHIDNAYVLAGMIPNATRRIITEIGANQTPQDYCAVFHASRVFNNLLGAFLLLRKGMLVEATILLRSLVEVAAQAILMMHDAGAAKRWTKGRRYTPGEVRKKLDRLGDLIQPLYNQLSAIAHANPEARSAHSVSIPGEGCAIFYGGSYQPKNVASLLAILADIILFYLDAFHFHYRDRISIGFWPFMIQLGREHNDGLRRWVQNLPDDTEALTTNIDGWRVSPMPPPLIDGDVLNQALARLQAAQAQNDSRS